MELPEVLFGEKVNLPLIAQAVRVYQMGQRQGDASTKTRGEVDGSTRKIYRQKGTGRARHGGIRAPIFVKGGIAHGPKPRDYDATLSKKMKLKAFVSALSAKCAEGSIRIVEGLESIEPKTKHAESFFRALELPKSSRSVLMVVPVAHQSAKRAFRNLAGVDTYNAEQISVYDVLSHKQLVFAKESISVLEKRRNA
jgi:large subunit ribosomal protein L4